MLKKILLLTVGVFAGSTAVIMIKASRMDPILLASFRQLIGAAILAPLAVRDWNRRDRTAGKPTAHAVGWAAAGIMLGLHFITWNVGARMTGAANASLVVNMTPVVMPFLLLAVARERVTSREIAGTAIAMAGVVLLAYDDFRVDVRNLAGDAMCFLSMLLFSGYLVVAKRVRSDQPLWLYVVPVYAVGGSFCLAVGCFVSRFGELASAREWVMAVGLAVIPTIIGHSILNHAMRVMRGQIVAVLNLAQFLFAGLLAFALRGEMPTARFYAAAPLIVLGSAVVILRNSGNRR